MTFERRFEIPKHCPGFLYLYIMCVILKSIVCRYHLVPPVCALIVSTPLHHLITNDPEWRKCVVPRKVIIIQVDLYCSGSTFHCWNYLVRIIMDSCTAVRYCITAQYRSLN